LQIRKGSIKRENDIYFLDSTLCFVWEEEIRANGQSNVPANIRNEVAFVWLALTGTRKSTKLRIQDKIGGEKFRINSRRSIVMENRRNAKKQPPERRDFDFWIS
jgi:hypothetical protein